MGTIAGVMALLLVLTIIFGVQTFRLSRQVKALSGGAVTETDGNASSPAQSDGNAARSDLTDPQGADAPVEEAVAAEELSDEYPDYAKLFPELYVEPTAKVAGDKQRVIYLTFDDGPSEHNTRKLLNILDQYNAKATFFVTGQFGTVESRAALYQEILSRGHSLGLHSMTHDYADIYKSVEDYLADLNAIYQEVYEATGEQIQLIRFPGGSVNGYNDGIYQQLIAEVTRRGFTYTDWHVSADDAIGTPDTGEIIDRVVESSEQFKKAIVLCHDTEQQSSTALAIPDIIEILSGEGYQFRGLDATVQPRHFNYISAQ